MGSKGGLFSFIRETGLAFDIASFGIWAFFAVEFSLKLLLVQDRAAYLRANWIDVVTVAVPMLRPVRVVMAAVVFVRFMIELRELLLGNSLKFSVIGCVVVVAVCSRSRHRGVSHAGRHQPL